MSLIAHNIHAAGFDTTDYLVCSRQVNAAYSTSNMSRAVSESLMREIFGVVTPTEHDIGANVALRYMITEFVKRLCNGIELQAEDVVRFAGEKTQQFFINQPWFVPGSHSSIQDNPGAVEVVDVAVEDIKIERTKIGNQVIKPKKGLKQEAAKRIFEANVGKPNKDIIALFMTQLDMSKPGATTYLYNLKKASGGIEPNAKKGRKPNAS